MRAFNWDDYYLDVDNGEVSALSLERFQEMRAEAGEDWLDEEDEEEEEIDNDEDDWLDDDDPLWDEDEEWED